MERGHHPASPPGWATPGLAQTALALFSLFALAIAVALATPPAWAHPAPQHAAPQHTAPAAIPRPPIPATLPLAACVAPARPGDTAAALFDTPARFDCTGAQSHYGPGDYWVRLTPPPGTDLAGLKQVGFIATWQAGAVLTARHADGTFASFRLDNATLSTLTRIGSREVLPLPGNATPVTALLLHLHGAVNASGLVFDPVLANDAANDHAERLETAIYALFAGLCIALLVYNSMLWFTVRERFQAVYCLTVLSMLTYAWSSSGALSLGLPDADMTLHFRINYPSLALVGALALRFFVDFLEAGAVPRWLRRLVNAHGLVLFAAGMAVALAPIGWVHLLDRIYAASFIPVPVLAVAIGVVAGCRGSHAIRVLILAWAAPLLMAVVRIAHALNFIDYSASVAHSAVIAMSLEAVLSSLAMASRIERIVAERDLALTEERMARRLAEIDPLTSLLNRRALLARVLAWGNAEPLRLMLIDVDHFKAINDRHGHDVGDEVLRELAGIFSQRADLRASVSRVGGEEFALVGTASELPSAVALAILADVRNHPFQDGIAITVSIGVAEAPVHDETDWRKLYRAADAALYSAKQAGRNRVVDAGDVPERQRSSSSENAGCRNAWQPTEATSAVANPRRQ